MQKTFNTEPCRHPEDSARRILICPSLSAGLRVASASLGKYLKKPAEFRGIPAFVKLASRKAQKDSRLIANRAVARDS